MSSGETRELIFVVQGDITHVESGARRRFREAFDYLAAHFDSVTLYSFYEDGISAWDDAAVARFRTQFPRVNLVLDHKGLTHRLFTRFKQILSVFFPHLGKSIIKLSLPWLSPNFALLKKTSANPCFFMCGIDNIADLNGIPQAALIADTLDVKFLHYAIAQKLPLYDWRVIAKMRMELSLLSCFDALVAISRSEAALLDTFSPGRQAFFVPSFEEEPALASTRPKTGYVFDLLFVGTAYHFNLIGLLGFLRENEDWLKSLRIAIAGKVSLHPQVVDLAKDWPGIRLMGFVDDLGPLYAQTKLAISPVEGTGLKIKILEALKHGTPVAASKSSVDGLPDGYEKCVFPLNRAPIEQLLTDQSALLTAEQATDDYLSRGAFTEERDALQRFLHGKLKSTAFFEEKS